MDITLSPKDTTQKIELNNVKYFTQEHRTFLVVFEDGSTRNYPFEHIWYLETKKSEDGALIAAEIDRLSRM